MRIRNILLVLFIVLSINMAKAEGTTVIITTDDTYNNPALINTMQNNLANLLDEINNAQQEGRLLEISNMPINKRSQHILHTLWSNSHFYCDDAEVVDRGWPLSDGFLLRQIPLIMTGEESGFGKGNYQEAVVEFDNRGDIRDFRFAFDSQLGLSMERCGKVVEESRKLQILAYCDRLATAYSTKDINFIEQCYSPDALIITGNEVKAVPGKIVYKSYTTDEYLASLRRCFKRNKYVNVQFSEIGKGGLEGGCGTVTQSTNNPNFYGVRLKQEWRSSTYSDVGYLFLLWDFTNPNEPIIHVRTWQPEKVNNQPLPVDEIFSLSTFEDQIK